MYTKGKFFVVGNKEVALEDKPEAESNHNITNKTCLFI